MSWFVAHAIFFIRVAEGTQDEFPVWEDMYLVQAKSGHEALDKAKKIARRIESDTKAVRYGGRRALQIFAGIRKVVKATDTLLEPKLRDGIEISYSQYETE